MPFENRKKIFQRILLNQYCHTVKNTNLKFNNLGIFQSLKLRILMGKKPSNFSWAKFHPKYLGRVWVKSVFWVRMGWDVEKCCKAERFCIVGCRAERHLKFGAMVCESVASQPPAGETSERPVPPLAPDLASSYHCAQPYISHISALLPAEPLKLPAPT